MIRGFPGQPGIDRSELAAATSSRRAALGWCATGFLAGVAFWHCVGFWSLVHTAVVRGEERSAPAATATVDRPAAPRRAPILETGSLPGPIKQSCVLLVLDRTGGATRQAPCPTGTFHHRNAGIGVKRDRETASPAPPGSNWSTQLEATEKTR